MVVHFYFCQPRALYAPIKIIRHWTRLQISLIYLNVHQCYVLSSMILRKDNNIMIRSNNTLHATLFL